MLGREPPVDLGLRLVAAAFLRRDLTLQAGALANPLVEALAGEHRKLDFGHVEPTAMLGRIAKIQL